MSQTRIVSAVVERPWAITAEALATIVEIANRDNLTVEAVEAELGRKLDNTHTVTIRQGVATIPVEGPLFRRANLFTQISGATSTEILAQDLRAALTDTTVTAIMLAIDSPGGEANGISEFANMVYDARAQKPITAYISGLGASAAYWIASAASEVVVDHMALVGSIGVVMAVSDPTKSAAKDIEFVSSQSPNKRANPTTEKGRAHLQGIVDGMADVFVAAVARNRDVSEQTVLDDFGQGGIFVGETAVTAGLADRVGSYEQALADLASRALGRAGSSSRVSTDGSAGGSAPAAAGDFVTREGMVFRQQTQKQEGRQVGTETAVQMTQDQARFAELERQLAEVKATAEREKAEASALVATATAEAERATADARVAAERITAMEHTAQRRAYMEVAKEWPGASTEDYVNFMMTEIKTGAGLEWFTKLQTAHAAQVRAAGLWGEKGRAGQETTDDPQERVNNLVKATMAERNLTYREAASQVAAAHPDLVAAAKAAVEVKA